MSALVFPPLIFFVAANYWARRDYRYPPFLMSVVWLGSMALFFLSSLTAKSIDIITAFICVVAVASFTLGGATVLSAEGTFGILTTHPNPGELLPAHPRIRRLMLLGSCLLLPLFVYRAEQIAAQSGFVNFFIALRSELTGEDAASYGIIGNATILSFLTTFVYAIELRDRRLEKAGYYLSVFVSLIYAFFITGRTPYFLIVVVLLAIAAMRGRFNALRLTVGVLVIAVAFSAGALMLGKGADASASVLDNAASIGDSLAVYCVGPLAAFDKLVRERPPLAYGKNMLGTFLSLIYRIEGEKPISPIQEWVYVPFPVNVYTGLQPVYLDFGLLGVAAVFAFIGAISTRFYIKAVTGDALHTLLYALSVFPLAYSVFSDQYFAVLGTWIKYLVAGYLYFNVGESFESRALREGLYDAALRTEHS